MNQDTPKIASALTRSHEYIDSRTGEHQVHKFHKFNSNTLAWHVFIQWISEKDLLDEWLQRSVDFGMAESFFDKRDLDTIPYSFTTHSTDDTNWEGIKRQWQRLVKEGLIT